MPYKDINKRREVNRISTQKWRDNNPGWRKKYPSSRYTKRSSEYQKAARKKYLSDPMNRLKDNARQRLNYAVKTGKLIRPDTCSNCGFKGKIQADHHDYSKPLEVSWICSSCHGTITSVRLRNK